MEKTKCSNIKFCLLSLFLISLRLQVLFQQFKFFLNLYFLVIALTQFIPQLRIGYLYTYWGPLVSVCVCRNLEGGRGVQEFLRDSFLRGTEMVQDVNFSIFLAAL